VLWYLLPPLVTVSAAIVPPPVDGCFTRRRQKLSARPGLSINLIARPHCLTVRPPVGDAGGRERRRI
jgi:hypothetical protein